MKRTLQRGAAILGLLVAIGVGGCGGASSAPVAPSAPGYVIPAADLSAMLSEKVLGNPDAGVTLVEYSSFTCPHCATFHQVTLPSIKATYIDSGKVKLVYRDFPVRGASSMETAYAASALARCAGSVRYFEALDLLYEGQATWVASGDPVAVMKQVLAPLGMPGEKMDACVASAEIRSEINRVATEGTTSYGIGGTPSFVIDGQVMWASQVEPTLRQMLQ